jgi:hypothetical protein
MFVSQRKLGRVLNHFIRLVHDEQEALQERSHQMVIGNEKLDDSSCVAAREKHDKHQMVFQVLYGLRDSRKIAGSDKRVKRDATIVKYGDELIKQLMFQHRFKHAHNLPDACDLTVDYLFRVTTPLRPLSEEKTSLNLFGESVNRAGEDFG